MLHFIGNALNPFIDSDHIVCIAHVCNNQGVMGAGIARFIAQKWPQAAVDFRTWANRGDYDKLGHVQFLHVVLNERPAILANMVAQTLEGHRFPLSMPHLEDCLRHVAMEYSNVHIPRIGAGLARGHWEDIAELIPATWHVYTLPQELEKFPPMSDWYSIAPEFQPHFAGRLGVLANEAASLYRPNLTPNLFEI